VSEGAIPDSAPLLTDLVLATGEINLMFPLDFAELFLG